MRKSIIAFLSCLILLVLPLQVPLAGAQSERAQLTWLGTLGGYESFAVDVSADGRVVVGWAETTGESYHAFRWTEEEGMEDLGTLGGDDSDAEDVSSDGRVVVGEAGTTGGDYHSFRWTEEKGMEDLNVVYENLLDGSQLECVNDISPDGRFIVGRGYNSETDRIEAFLLATGVAPEKKVPKPFKHFPWALVSVMVIITAGIVGVWYLKRHRQGVEDWSASMGLGGDYRLSSLRTSFFNGEGF